MKSTLKISLQTGNRGLRPVIKIVQPQEILETHSWERTDDEDPRDDMIKNFLQSDLMASPYNYFTIGSSYPLPNLDAENPTHRVNTIEPIEEEDLFYRFKHSILNRMVPYEDLVAINRGETIVEPAANEKVVKESQSRLIASQKKHKIITDFFDWVKETGYCTWEEQQPN